MAKADLEVARAYLEEALERKVDFTQLRLFEKNPIGKTTCTIRMIDTIRKHVDVAMPRILN